MTEFLPPPAVERFPALGEEFIRRIGPDVLLGRIYCAGGDVAAGWDEFRSFGPTQSRFDHHLEPVGAFVDRAVMYAAPALVDARGEVMSVLETALMESFGEAAVVDVRTDSPYFVVFSVVRELRLLDLADSEWAAVAGGSGAMSCGPRELSREWARAIYEHYRGDGLDGVLYATSTLPGSRSVALWEGARDAVASRPAFHEPLDHVGLRAAVEEFAYRVGLGVVA